MYNRITALQLMRSVQILFAFIIICSFSSCLRDNAKENPVTKRQLKIADSLMTAGQDEGVQLMYKTRKKIRNTDPAITTYYCWESHRHMNNFNIMDAYADSALSFFYNDSRIEKFPDEYFNALLTKGDACLKQKKYIAGLNYFYQARKVLSKASCDDGSLAGKMGGIYYSQRNFKVGARYWADSYNRLEQCHDQLTAEKLFEFKQGDLNNAGFSYDRAGMLDSALYYYAKNMQVINEADSLHIAQHTIINGARIVMYDNFGGLYLKKGKLDEAKKYLDKCIAVQYDNKDGIKIPPLLKLTEIYLLTGDIKNAAISFNKSRALLDSFLADNGDSEIIWNKLYAQYLFKVNQPARAYEYENKYIKLRDSTDNGSAEIYRLDVERELSGINQQQAFVELGQKERIKLLYMVVISITAILTIVIIILINRSLQRSERDHKSAKLHNQQLQQTLDELERVNKNYIRIMRVMAHDLRNPLSGMTGLAANLLEEDDLNEDSKHLLRLIETTGTHTMEMINELLKSGLADENAPIQKQPVDLTALLYDSVELLQFKANEKQQQLVFESDDTPIIAEINHENIWRVFNNLIVNAIKFSHEEGVIRVSIKLKKNIVTIAIADDGIGIPDKDKDNVFEMFTPAKKMGTAGEEPFGLGLSISKKIIERHKGKIWFESTIGVGTTFYIELPMGKK